MATEAPARARGRILVVDDEANARAALSEILRDEGYATETAGDGFKALGKIEEFAPDVVLTDLKMPGLDGIAFMEKAKSASPQTVFVVMTAFGSITSAVSAIKKGADNYLTKPLDYEALCAASPRAGSPFVRLHCAALAESLLESELFGHEKGAFTGAFARREGRFKQADGGTLFLDEIGEIPQGTQVKLLRFLQEKTFERVGGNETL
jgi:DNA-binding NtrC family response regulator